MPSTLKQILTQLARQKAPGPTSSFSSPHVLLALELMAEKSVGRNMLARELEIGEGAARTLIRRLREAELISTSRAGSFLAEKGLKLWKGYKSAFHKCAIEKNELTFAEHSFAVLVKNRGHVIKTGIEQRDAAVTAGAKSATTLWYRKGCLAFPTVSKALGRDFPGASAQIMRLLHPQENDAVVIVSSDNSKKAEQGALLAALTLLDDDN